MDDRLFCFLHECDDDAPSAPAISIVLGMAVCGECMQTVIASITSGETYSAHDFIRDAAAGGWVAR